jgi:class 3 adenylate cyclase
VRRTIGLKIFGLVALLSLLAAAVAWVNSRQADDVSTLLAEVGETYTPIYAALSRHQARSLEQALSVRRLVINFLDTAADMAERDRLRAAADRQARDTDAELATARRLIAQEIEDPVTFSDKVLLGQLGTRLEFVQRDRVEYEAQRERLMRSLAAGDRAETAATLAALDVIRDRLTVEGERVRGEMLVLLDGAVALIETKQRAAVRYGLVLLAAALGLGLVVAGTLTAGLVRPLRRLLEGAVAVQKGALDGEVPVTTSDEVGALTAAFNQMVRELRTKQRVREAFGRYLDPRIVEGLVERPELLSSKGERRVMTICFSDMKGFTELSEGLTPVTLVNVINHYLTAMSQPIRDHAGIIDKYAGDSIMAFWGPPFCAAHEQARLACQASLAQLETLPAVREKLPEVLGIKHHLPQIDMRIGIATGDVVVGNIGSPQSMSYTVMGDSVNLASRLEGANKHYGTHMLVAEATVAMAAEAFEFREIDLVRVVGQQQPQRIFDLLGRRGAVPPARRDLAAQFAAGLAAYRGRDWGEAEAAFRRCLEIDPGDGPAAAFLGRLARFADRPPAPDWNGVWRLGEK